MSPLAPSLYYGSPAHTRLVLFLQLVSFTLYSTRVLLH